jgi:thiamine kinase-like enzyme
VSTIEYDLGYLEEALDLLETYLVSKSLFFPIGAQSPSGGSPYPRLTLGNLMFSQALLDAKTLLPHQSAKLNILKVGIEEIHNKWSVSWARKARRELNSRLRQWQQYINELQQEPDGFIDYYGNEVRLRVLVDLLGSDVDPVGEQSELQINKLDKLLNTILTQGDFIWEEVLAEKFYRNRFWYLWGKPDIEKLQKYQTGK